MCAAYGPSSCDRMCLQRLQLSEWPPVGARPQQLLTVFRGHGCV